LSPDPDTIFEPSGEQPTEYTRSSCPLNTANSFPELISLILIVLSQLPETPFEPSGGKAYGDYTLLMPYQHLVLLTLVL